MTLEFSPRGPLNLAHESLIARDFEEGSFANITNALFNGGFWDGSSMTWNLFGVSAGNPFTQSLREVQRGWSTSTPTFPVSSRPVVAGCGMSRTLAKRLGVAARVFLQDDGWGTFVTTAGATTSLAKAIGSAPGGNLLTMKAVAFESGSGKWILACNEATAGGNVYIHYVTPGSATVSDAGTFTTSAPSGCTLAGASGNGVDLIATVRKTAAGSAHAFYRSASATPSFSLISNPLAALLPSGDVDLVGLDYDPGSNRFVVCWHQRSGTGSPAVGFAVSSDGLSWTAVPGVQNIPQATPSLLGVGNQPVGFACHRGAWVLAMGGGGSPSVALFTSFDFGKRWQRAQPAMAGSNYTAGSTAGEFGAKLISGSRGFVWLPTITASGSFTNAIYTSPTSGRGGVYSNGLLVSVADADDAY